MKKVLVINDDPDFQYLIKHYLEREGYTAMTVDDHKPVFKHIQSFDPDLIILDIQNERDTQICKALREKNIWIPLVLLTDQEPVDDIKYFADAVIRKPFQPNQFLNSIKDLM
jgi:DNA-binding response OmpR family regulator